MYDKMLSILFYHYMVCRNHTQDVEDDSLYSHTWNYELNCIDNNLLITLKAKKKSMKISYCLVLTESHRIKVEFVSMIEYALRILFDCSIYVYIFFIYFMKNE